VDAKAPPDINSTIPPASMSRFMLRLV